MGKKYVSTELKNAAIFNQYLVKNNKSSRIKLAKRLGVTVYILFLICNAKVVPNSVIKVINEANLKGVKLEEYSN